MVLSKSMEVSDTMPQTVPSAGFTPPCDYSAFADSFDLSLLPSYESNDAELPAYPPVSYYTPSPPSMFPGGAEDLFGKSSVKSPPQIFTSFYPNSPIDSKEDLHNSLCQSPYGSPYQQQQLNYNKDDTHQYLVPFFPVSPSTSSNTSYSNRSSPIYPQSVSPVYPIKNENTIDLNEILEESHFLQKTISGNNQQPLFPLSPQQFPQKGPDVQEPIKEPKSENTYQLLREVLRDTSFQKKYNLRPFEFGNIGTGFVGCIKMEEQKIKMEPDDGQKEEDKRRDEALMSSCNEELTRQKIEPVLNMAIQQMRKDVDNTCLTLGISTDPNQWSTEDVKAWLLWTLQQFGLGPIQMEYFNMDGSMFACLSEEDFSQRAPQSGSILHAQLEIWKAARMEAELGGNGAIASTSGGGETSVGAVGWNKAQPGSNQSSNASSGDASEDDDEESPAPAKVAAPSTSTSTTPATAKAPSSRGAGSTGSSHIHLWQFLKELLASPSLYGSAIRWIDRSKGVFKIEDSVRVARLWGKRKNRPAMNYDKLSRSIRQYYKKGIMKKTERSQRLVYQFCHPYCL